MNADDARSLEHLVTRTADRQEALSLLHDHYCGCPQDPTHLGREAEALVACWQTMKPREDRP
jgi:hypothetical protein